MTVFIPTTTVTIERADEAPDSWGDVRPSTTDLQTGIPAAVTAGVGLIGRTDQRTYQPADARAGVTEDYTIRLRGGVDVTENDRLVDERTGAVYQVVAVFHAQSIVGLADIRVMAMRVGAASPSSQ